MVVLAVRLFSLFVSTVSGTGPPRKPEDFLSKECVISCRHNYITAYFGPP